MRIETMECIKNIWWAFVLVVGSFMDIRKKSVSKVFMGATCSVSAVILLTGYLLSVNNIGFMQASVGMAIGAVVMVASVFSNGCIGMADAILVLLTGLLFGYTGSIEMTLYAIFFAAVVSIILISLGKANRKSRIPFIPFMFLGYVIYSLRSV